jgi:hypothetical protein
MITRYSVFQYVPDPVTGERVNFGVVVYNERTVLVRFVRRWRRIRSFAGKDVTFLRRFAARVEESADPSVMLTDLGPVVRLDDTLIRQMSERWVHSIQVTEPRAGVMQPERMLDQISAKFLREGSTSRRSGLSRHAAASAALSGVRAALEEETRTTSADLAKELLKPGGVLRGRLAASRFDAVVQNGSPILAAHGLSFQGQDSDRIEKDVNAISFSLSDVRQQYPEIPLALVAIPPRFDISGEFDRARDICAGLEVEVIGMDEVEGWARPVVREYLG